MIRCVKCKQEKEDSLFPWRNQSRGIRQQYCKSCKSEYNKTWYSKNKTKHKNDVSKNNEKRRLQSSEIIRKLKEVPCADCKVQYPYYVMDFDHLEDFQKLNEVSRMYLYSQKNILDEIAKCEVVCSNCHRERTFKRKVLVSPLSPNQSLKA